MSVTAFNQRSEARLTFSKQAERNEPLTNDVRYLITAQTIHRRAACDTLINLPTCTRHFPLMNNSQ